MSLCFPLPILRAAIAFGSAIAVGSAVTDAAPGPLALTHVLREVAEQHPQVRAAQALADAEREKIARASAWDDPVAGVEFMRRDTLRPLRSDETEFSLSQKLPLTAQRPQRAALAKAEAAAAASRVPAQLSPLLIRATDAFYRLARARDLLDLTRRNDEILARAVAAMQERLADGAGDVTGVLLAETERVRLQEPVIALHREAAEAANTLNTLRGLPSETAIGALDSASDPAGAPLGSFADLRDQALAHRPELRAAEAQVTAAERATDLTRAWLPDPEVTVRARHLRGRRDPISEYDTALSISLPWLNREKYRAATREAQRRRDAAALDAVALRAQTLADLHDAWTRHEAAARSVALFRDRLAPLAERSLTAALTGLDSGKSGILELISAQKNLREVRNALVDAQAERSRALAIIGAMTGRNFFNSP
ncbi:MAG: TolC family protein [Undibacterium sp.]|nr:TolC family protein [Opitutaceae bacterium]